MKVSLREHLAVCVSPSSAVECLNKSLWNLACISGTSAHLKGVLHKTFLLACVPVRLFLLLLLGKGSRNPFPWQRIHEKEKKICLAPVASLISGPICVSADTFPRQWRIVGGAVFYAVRVVSKENRRLCLSINTCNKLKIYLIDIVVLWIATPFSRVDSR
jgi:hypothetical protein